MKGDPAGHLEAVVEPPSPLRLPTRASADRVSLSRGGRVTRILRVAGAPVLVSAGPTQGARGITVRATGLDPDAVEYSVGPRGEPRRAGPDELCEALDRMRFALWLDEDVSEFLRAHRGDKLLGPVLRARPWVRPKRRALPWEALAWAIVGQLIEASEAARIQRRLVGRFGPRLGGRAPSAAPSYRDVPDASEFAGCAPAELVATGLAESRSLALIRCAREVASGRADLERVDSDQRLARIPGIGPWTLQLLARDGRGDLDSLPAGDLAYLKLVGRLAGLGRRASVAEVEEFFEPYAPWRGLAGAFALSGLYRRVAEGPPMPNPAWPVSRAAGAAAARW